MAIVTPIVTKWVFAPFFRRFIEYRFARFDHISNIILMTLVLSAFIAIAGFTGTSVLFGAFLAGVFLTYIPSKHPEGPFVVMSREEGEREADKSPTFVHTFEKYLLGPQQYLMEPLFFASIGFAIPFLKLWTGKRIWRGVVYTLLMAFAKVCRYSEPFLGKWAIELIYLHSVSSESGSPYGNSFAGVNLIKERQMKTGKDREYKKTRTTTQATKHKTTMRMGRNGTGPGSPQHF